MPKPGHFSFLCANPNRLEARLVRYRLEARYYIRDHIRDRTSHPAPRIRMKFRI